MAKRSTRWPHVITPRGVALALLPAAIALTSLLPMTSAANGLSVVEQQIRSAARGPSLRLTLVDGRQVVGVYRGFVGDWSDSIASTIRYERWRNETASIVPAIGTPLTLVLASGDTLRGALWGFIPSAVLIAHPDAAVATQVPLTTITAWGRDDDPADLEWPRVRELVTDAPPISGVALDQGTRHVVVTREQIVSADEPKPTPAAQHSTASYFAVAVVAGAIGAILVCAYIGNQVNDSFSSCKATPTSNSEVAFARAGFTPGSPLWPPGETRRP